MNKVKITSTYKAAVVAPLVVALLVGAPFSDGLLLHDHSDQGVHAHAVMFDDLRDEVLGAAGHHHAHEHGTSQSNECPGDSDAGMAEVLVLFVSAPGHAALIYGSFGATIASMHRSVAEARPLSITSNAPYDSARFSTASQPSAQPLRPSCTLDALLQSSHALLL